MLLKFFMRPKYILCPDVMPFRNRFGNGYTEKRFESFTKRSKTKVRRSPTAHTAMQSTAKAITKTNIASMTERTVPARLVERGSLNASSKHSEARFTAQDAKLNISYYKSSVLFPFFTPSHSNPCSKPVIAAVSFTRSLRCNRTNARNARDATALSISREISSDLKAAQRPLPLPRWYCYLLPSCYQSSRLNTSVIIIAVV